MPETPLQQLSINIQKCREFSGFSQQDLAFKTDLSLSTISRIERGETDPSLTTLFIIAKAFSVDVGYLVKGI